MSFKKIDKEFCMTDNSVNSYGFRLLTEGFQINRFNPPIGYLMHNREGGVAVKWEDFRLDGDKLWARPVVNTLKYPSLADEIEAGFYNAASVGHIIALEWTDDASMKLDGQTGITVTKWFCRECSIVDIPGNYNALAELYDKDENSLKNLISQPQSQQKPAEVVKQPSGSVLQTENTEAAIPDKYIGMSYNQLWMSGDLEHLKMTHPLYVLQLQEQDRQEREKVRNRGAQVSDGKLAKAIDTALNPEAIPDQYLNKTKQELFLNGGLDYLKAHHPDVFNDLMSK